LRAASTSRGVETDFGLAKSSQLHTVRATDTGRLVKAALDRPAEGEGRWCCWRRRISKITSRGG